MRRLPLSLFLLAASSLYAAASIDVKTGTLQVGNATAVSGLPITLEDATTLLSPVSLVLPNTITLNGNATKIETFNTYINTLTLSGNIGEIISGQILQKLGTGTLVLSGTNTYTGGTLLNGGILQLGNNGGLPTNSTLTFSSASTLDLNGFSATLSNLIGSSGTVLNNDTGFGGTLTLAPTSLQTFGGVIANGTATVALTINGTSTQILTGANTYTGGTTINAGALKLGSSTAFPSSSPLNFTGAGTFDLNGNSLTLSTLTGTAGTIENTGSSATTLTINNTTTAGSFAGSIINTIGAGALSLTVTGSQGLTLSGNNTYTGGTTIDNVILSAGSSTALPPAGIVTMTNAGELDIKGNTVTIGGLNSTSSSSDVKSTVSNTGMLIINGTTVNSSFAGSIGNGGSPLGLTISGNKMVTLSGSNSYNKGTTITGGTLQLASANAFPSFTSLTMNGNGFLDLNGQTIFISGLNGSSGTIENSSVTAVNLNISETTVPETFAGSIINNLNTGAITVSISGTQFQTLSGTNTYTGGTSIGGMLRLGSATALPSTGEVSLDTSGVLDLNGFNTILGGLSSNTGTIENLINTPVTFTIQTSSFPNYGGTIVNGVGTGPITLIKSGTGTQALSGTNTYTGGTIIEGGTLQVAAAGAIPTGTNLTFTGGTLDLNGNNITVGSVQGNAGTITISNSTLSTLTIADNTSAENFGGILTNGAGTLALTISGSATQTLSGNNFYTGATNILSGARLQAGSNTGFSIVSDFTLAGTAILDLNGFNPTIQSLNGSSGTVKNTSASPALLTINLANNLASFGGSITNGVGPVSVTISGTNTEVFTGTNTYTGSTTVDSGELRLGSSTALTATSSLNLTNYGDLDLGGFNATVGSLNSASGDAGFVYNVSSTPVVFTIDTTTQSGSYFGQIEEYPGMISVVKQGSNTQVFAPGMFASVYTGSTTVQDGTLEYSGDAAFSPNSAAIVQSPGTLFFSSGTNTSPSLTSAGSVINAGNTNFNIITISGGTVNNQSGATLGLGSGGGLFQINGGAVTNNTNAILGSSTSNLALNAGSLITSGEVLALNYSQGNSAQLQINVLSAMSHGLITAADIANLDGTLIVYALPGLSVESTDVIDIITAGTQRVGTFSNVEFQNFPSYVTPTILYLDNAVELTFMVVPPPPPPPPVPPILSIPSAIASTPQLTLSSVNEFNVRIAREQGMLHSRLLRRELKSKKDISFNGFTANNEIELISSPEESPEFKSAFFTRIGNGNHTEEKEYQLSKNVSEEAQKERPYRVYIGPTSSFGSVNSVNDQKGFGYHAVGAFAGADYAFDNVGLGIEVDYENISATVHNNYGHSRINEAHGSCYATAVPKSLRELAFNAIVGGGYNWYEINRTASPGIASGNPHGGEFDALLGVEYIFSDYRYNKMPKNFEITPTVNLQYMYSNVPNYVESGAGINDKTVPSQTFNSLRTFLGSRFDYTKRWKKVAVRAELDLGWQREYLNKNSSLALGIPGSSAAPIIETTYGLGRNTYLVGADLLFTVKEVFQIEASYDWQWNRMQINNSFYLGLGGRF